MKYRQKLIRKRVMEKTDMPSSNMYRSMVYDLEMLIPNLDSIFGLLLWIGQKSQNKIFFRIFDFSPDLHSGHIFFINAFDRAWNSLNIVSK